jgi:hypothetical protein
MLIRKRSNAFSCEGCKYLKPSEKGSCRLKRSKKIANKPKCVLSINCSLHQFIFADGEEHEDESPEGFKMKDWSLA